MAMWRAQVSCLEMEMLVYWRTLVLTTYHYYVHYYYIVHTPNALRKAKKYGKHKKTRKILKLSSHPFPFSFPFPPSAAETGLEILHELLMNVGRTPAVAQAFYRQFLLSLIQVCLCVPRGQVLQCFRDTFAALETRLSKMSCSNDC